MNKKALLKKAIKEQLLIKFARNLPNFLKSFEEEFSHTSQPNFRSSARNLQKPIMEWKPPIPAPPPPPALHFIPVPLDIWHLKKEPPPAVPILIIPREKPRLPKTPAPPLPPSPATFYEILQYLFV